jgi:ADP-heptose:LPS heptosyltransferase
MIRKTICLLGKILFLFKKRKVKDDVNKILVVRSGAIGDVVMTTPFLKSLNLKFPKAEIVYLVGEWSKSILSGNKSIDKVISFDDDIVYKKKLFKLIKLICLIRKEKFDLCYILDKSYHWSILGWLFKIKFRVGFDRFGEGFANNKNVFYDGSKYEVDYNLELIDGSDSSMEIVLDKKDIKFAEGFVKKKKLNGFIGIAPGGAKNPGQEMSIKRWPLEKYISLIEKLCLNNKIVLFGGPGDKEIVEEIMLKVKNENLINVVGKTSLKQAAALIKKSKLFITHDSGLMHIAASTGVKQIVLFGPTPSHRFAPKNAVVIESKLKGCPCYDIYGGYDSKIGKECMNNISVEDVLKKVKVLKL